MDKEALVKILMGLLKTESDLDFLLELKKEDLEKLVAVIRDRLSSFNFIPHPSFRFIPHFFWFNFLNLSGNYCLKYCTPPFYLMVSLKASFLRST